MTNKTTFADHALTTPDTPAHTPLRLSAGDETRIMDNKGFPLIDVPCGGMSGRRVKDAEQIAAFIVRACNSHYLLIEAVERLLNMPGDIDTECNPPEMQQRVLKERLETWQFARAALSQAGGHNAD